MQIKSLWALRKGYEAPELLVAWDEISIDENWDGFQEDVKRAIDAIGEDAVHD
jgi:hypothetical protein